MSPVGTGMRWRPEGTVWTASTAFFPALLPPHLRSCACLHRRTARLILLVVLLEQVLGFPSLSITSTLSVTIISPSCSASDNRATDILYTRQIIISRKNIRFQNQFPDPIVASAAGPTTTTTHSEVTILPTNSAMILSPLTSWGQESESWESFSNYSVTKCRDTQSRFRMAHHGI